MLRAPKIYVFSMLVGGGEGSYVALAEDGNVLGSHYCSSENFAKHDLGVVTGARPDRHADYRAHYPDGYEMVFVPSAEVDKHPGVQAALTLNQTL